MAAFADVVSSVMIQAGKSSATDKTEAERGLRRTIQAINRAMSNWVVASRDKSIAVTAGAKDVTLPTNARRIKDLGRYDSATDRISTAYVETTENSFNERYSGATTLQAIDPTNRNEWFFLDDTSAGALKVRLVYPPTVAFTMMITFYEKLTEQNCDKLDDDDLLYNGLVARLVGWFPAVAASHFHLYNEGLDELRAARRSSKRTIAEKMHPEIEAHNVLMAYLTQ